MNSPLVSILYIGPANGTCLDRANALRRLGHQVEHVDPRSLLPATVWVDRVTWKLGGQWFGLVIARALKRVLGSRRFDLCHVDGGEWITPAVIDLLRQHAGKIVNYSIDDPLGQRDGARSNVYRTAVPHYDLCVVVREKNIEEAKLLGARNVLRVFRSADEISHRPRVLSSEDISQWTCDVLFLGTWFPERGPLLAELAGRNVPLTIIGPRWEKAPEWSYLRRYWKAGAIGGDAYAKAIQCAKVNLGLLSAENRDLHTTRSLEIPALGGLLCAERTIEHASMYDEKQEALFWSDASECAEMCRYALNDEVRRRRIAAEGYRRIRQNGHYNEVVMTQILGAAMNWKN